jgi:hypothetical protein
MKICISNSVFYISSAIIICLNHNIKNALQMYKKSTGKKLIYNDCCHGYTTKLHKIYIFFYYKFTIFGLSNTFQSTNKKHNLTYVMSGFVHDATYDS